MALTPRRSRRGSCGRGPASVGAVETLEHRLLLTAEGDDLQTTPGAGSELAYYGESGRLITPLDAQGNRISDFSTAGYRNSEVALPDALALVDPSRVITVTPGAGDDTAVIQAALDQAGSFSLDANGFRGVVQLTAGEYQIANTVRINDSGVVLLGVGDGDDPSTNTILRGTDTRQYNLVEVGAASGFVQPISGTIHNVVDEYVPVGATSLRVDSTSGWNVGDEIVIRRQPTAAWISEIGMDMIPPRGDGSTVQWDPDNPAFTQDYERTITRIEGDRIFFNAPIMNALDAQYDVSTVFRYTFTTPRIENVGIESIRGVSDFNGATDEDHARSFIVLNGVSDAWVRNVTGQYLVYATVHATGRSIRVTVDDAQSLDPVSQITGARRYAFNIDGQFVLMRNLYSENGRHDFVNNSPTRNRGPNVFLDGVAVNANSSVGPHQRWSTGTLYDTISTDGETEARNRGNFGSGHGWGGANMVFWNNTADRFIVQNPQTAQNWVIGSTGQIINETRFGPQPQGTYSEHGTPIDFQDAANPTNSLFIAQLNQRLADPNSDHREYVVGDFDLVDFDGVGSVDDVFVDPNWRASILGAAGATPVESLDESTDGQYVPLTIDFQLDSNEGVQAAVLSIGVRGTGGSTADDVLWFESTTDSRLLSSLGAPADLSTTETTVITIELLGSDLAALQDGRLNLAVSENTIVDWAALDLQISSNAAPIANDATFVVSETAATSTSVGTVSAFDPDAATSGALTYTIIGGNVGGAFEIDSQTGEIRIANGSAIDFEVLSQYQLQIDVTDEGTPALSDIATVSVIVSDVNEQPTLTGGTFTIAENSRVGTFVGQVFASDPDINAPNNTLTFEIVSGNTDGAFAIDSDTGAITVANKAAVDFESTPQFQLTVVARDAGSPTMAAFAPVTVAVTDFDETVRTQTETDAAYSRRLFRWRREFEFDAAGQVARTWRVGSSQSGAATWTFDAIPDGTYLVSASWVAWGERTSSATYRVFDATGQLAELSVNQRVAPSSTVDENGQLWRDIAQVNVAGGRVVVQLSANAPGLLIADSVRLIPLAAPPQARTQADLPTSSAQAVVPAAVPRSDSAFLSSVDPVHEPDPHIGDSSSATSTENVSEARTAREPVRSVVGPVDSRAASQISTLDGLLEDYEEDPFFTGLPL